MHTYSMHVLGRSVNIIRCVFKVDELASGLCLPMLTASSTGKDDSGLESFPRNQFSSVGSTSASKRIRLFGSE